MKFLVLPSLMRGISRSISAIGSLELGTGAKNSEKRGLDCCLFVLANKCQNWINWLEGGGGGAN